MEIPTMFPRVPEQSVTFCIDTSGSMYQSLPVIKQHLIESLNKMAAEVDARHEPLFNIIEFNSRVTQWADKMVRCTPETVKVASEWINSLSASTGTNTLDALLTAYEDDDCDAVYLVTDSLPDQHPTTVLDNISMVAHSRPVHCVYLCVGGDIDAKVDEFLQNLSYDTFASYNIVTLTKHGCFEKLSPVVSVDGVKQRVIRTDTGLPIPNQKICGVTSSLQIDPELSLMNSFHHPYFHPYPYAYPLYPHPYGNVHYPYAWERYRTAHSWLTSQKEMLSSLNNVSLAAGALLVDMLVLVRRHSDGWFYKGVVRSQISTNKFLVALTSCKNTKYNDVIYQETYDYDIISYDDAKYHTIITGDLVLAPWQPDGEKFGAAVVIDGQELRQSDGTDEKQGITVKFEQGTSKGTSKGTTKDIPLNQAVWIQPHLFQRLTLEQRMPRSAKNELREHSDCYPSKNLTGYPISGARAPDLSIDLKYEPIIYPGLCPKYWPIVPNPVYSSPNPVVYKQHKKIKSVSVVNSDEIHELIPGTKLTTAELNDKVASQLSDHDQKPDKNVGHDKKGHKDSKDDLHKKMSDKLNDLLDDIHLNQYNT